VRGFSGTIEEAFLYFCGLYTTTLLFYRSPPQPTTLSTIEPPCHPLRKTIQTSSRKSPLQKYIHVLKSPNTRKNIHDIRYYLWSCLQEQGWSDVWQKLKKSSTSYSASEMSCITKLSKSFKGFYSESDFYSLVQGAAINLGFTHFQGNQGANSKLRQVRLRDFEIPMAGGFYLTQDCDQIHELFKVGEHLDTWNELPDLLEKVSYYLDHPSKAKKIAAAGRDHCLKNHTWENRFRDLLKELELF
ncbi:MAG: glycosyltransferase family 1 protein, partial [Roseofilum sp. SBFL]|uniref:glycosyltransferase n=2 Tax=unclassified Roseofilum TaxID=2620099 RepID=UPI001B168FC7